MSGEQVTVDVETPVHNEENQDVDDCEPVVEARARTESIPYVPESKRTRVVMALATALLFTGAVAATFLTVTDRWGLLFPSSDAPQKNSTPNNANVMHAPHVQNQNLHATATPVDPFATPQAQIKKPTPTQVRQPPPLDSSLRWGSPPRALEYSDDDGIVPPHTPPHLCKQPGFAASKMGSSAEEPEVESDHSKSSEHGHRVPLLVLSDSLKAGPVVDDKEEEVLHAPPTTLVVEEPFADEFNLNQLFDDTAAEVLAPTNGDQDVVDGEMKGRTQEGFPPATSYQVLRASTNTPVGDQNVAGGEVIPDASKVDAPPATATSNQVIDPEIIEDFPTKKMAFHQLELLASLPEPVTTCAGAAQADVEPRALVVTDEDEEMAVSSTSLQQTLQTPAGKIAVFALLFFLVKFFGWFVTTASFE